MAGFFLGIWYKNKTMQYGGTIVVRQDELREKTVYSLILDEYPEKLQFEKVIVFKVENPKESSDRE